MKERSGSISRHMARTLLANGTSMRIGRRYQKVANITLEELEAIFGYRQFCLRFAGHYYYVEGTDDLTELEKGDL